MRILELTSQLVIACDASQIVRKAEAVEHVRDGTERHTRVAALDRTQCRPRHACTFSDQLRREPAARASKPNVLPKLDEEAAYPR